MKILKALMVASTLTIVTPTLAATQASSYSQSTSCLWKDPSSGNEYDLQYLRKHKE